MKSDIAFEFLPLCYLPERILTGMNGPIAQVVALTCHANAYLAGKSFAPFFPGNSTCQFCEHVNFVKPKEDLFGKITEESIADTPDAWLTHLKTHGVLGIRLFCLPQNEPGISDRMSAGFVGGGGTWFLETLMPRQTSKFWISRWEVGDRNAPDRKIWRVAYGQSPERKTIALPAPDLKRVTLELNESLKEIHAFSEKHKIDGFTKCFHKAMDTIATQGKYLHGYHQDLAPQGFLSQEAAMLLDACQQSWVFGGMGSWNDMGFKGEDQKIYEQVSDRLFAAVRAAIADAASSSRFSLTSNP